MGKVTWMYMISEGKDYPKRKFLGWEGYRKGKDERGKCYREERLTERKITLREQRFWEGKVTRMEWLQEMKGCCSKMKG